MAGQANGQRRERGLAPQRQVYDASADDHSPANDSPGATIVKPLALLPTLAVLLFAAATASAEPAPAVAPLAAAVTLSRADAAGRTVRAIDLRRLGRTQPLVVHRELLVHAGQPLDLDQLDESVQRLNNLGLFRLVEARLVAAGRDGVRVVLRFDQKWTLLPIFAAGRGGGVLHMTVGAQETHLLARYLETGLYYQYFNGSHSGTVWLADPRLLHKRILGRLSLGVGNRVRTLYDDSGEAEGFWSRRRLFLTGDLQVDIRPRWLRVGGGLIAGLDRYDESTLTDTQRQVNDDKAVSLPPGRRDVLARLHLRLGRIDTTDYFQHGEALVVTADLAPSWLGSERPFARGTLAGFAYLRLGRTGNLGGRFVLGAISDAVPERMFYVGGLGWQRGFAEGRYRGLRLWNANLEARVSSLHHRIISLQHVFFCDLGAVGDNWGELIEVSRRPPLAIGTGVRLVLPLIARFLARLDVAMAFGERRQWRVSFGSQQFF